MADSNGFYGVKPISQLKRKDDELRAAKEALHMTDHAEGEARDDVNTPGSDAYLKRRQKEAEDDLRNAPRRER